jgi:hypothetical protein
MKSARHRWLENAGLFSIRAISAFNGQLEWMIRGVYPRSCSSIVGGVGVRQRSV